jgi:hypothetical protein
MDLLALTSQYAGRWGWRGLRSRMAQGATELLVSGRSAVRIRSPAPSFIDVRKRVQTEPDAPSVRCAQRFSSFRVACVALTMLAANRYVSWNGHLRALLPQLAGKGADVLVALGDLLDREQVGALKFVAAAGPGADLALIHLRTAGPPSRAPRSPAATSP